MHVLIIEDEPLVALEIADTLQRLGYDTWEMVDTEWEAVLRASKRTPDLVVSDVRLRIGNGIDAVEAIRRLLDVPVVFATANQDDIKSRVGRTSVIDKPFGQDDLERAIELAAGQQEATLPL